MELVEGLGLLSAVPTWQENSRNEGAFVETQV